MSAPLKRTVELTPEQDAFIEAKIASGEYADAGDVLKEGLKALQEEQTALERLLRTEAVEAYDRLQADPSRGIPLDEAFEDVLARHAERTRGQA